MRKPVLLKNDGSYQTTAVLLCVILIMAMLTHACTLQLCKILWKEEWKIEGK